MLVMQKHFNSYPRAKSKGVNENLPLIYIGKFVVAVVEFFKNLFLFIIQSCRQIVMMIGYVAYQFLSFFVFASAVSIRTDVAIE